MSHKQQTDPDLEAEGWVLCSDAARRINKTVQTIYRWIDKGNVEGTTIGGWRKYVKWNDVLDHIGLVNAKALKLVRTQPECAYKGKCNSGRCPKHGTG